jgi:hypothetical protein
MNPPLSNKHEIGFVSSFIIPERRERYLSLLGDPKRRGKLLNRLNHSQDVDLSLARPVPSGCAAESLAVLLEKMGAGEICYVIADASDMDGQTLPLRETCWRASAHGFGVVLSCVPGRLCFYKPESPTTSLRLVISTTASMLILLLCLLLPAGTWAWTRGWLFLVVVTAASFLSTLYLRLVNPDVIAGRVNRHEGWRSWDALLGLLGFLPTILAIPVVAALDDGRYH